IDQKIFVERRDDGTVEDAVLVHEMIHAVSWRFRVEANRRRASHLVEGITEDLTRRVLIRRYRMPRAKWLPRYADYVAFSESLPDLVGEQRLEECVFRQGYFELEKWASASLRPGAFSGGVRALQGDDVRAALASLSHKSHRVP